MFVKRGIVQALQDAFSGHPDPTVANSRVSVDFGHDRWKLPGVIVKFYERELPNAGVAHVEYLPSATNSLQYYMYYHRRYKGDISFDIYGQSGVDRDLMRDALVEVLAMTDATTGGYAFIQRLYWALADTPYGLWHYPVLNLDLITGYGEQVAIAPWQPEDMLVYQASYRVPIIGEFYSNTPADPPFEAIDQVDLYPYTATDPLPADNPDPVYPTFPDPVPTSYTGPLPPVDGWYHFTGWSSGTEDI